MEVDAFVDSLLLVDIIDEMSGHILERVEEED